MSDTYRIKIKIGDYVRYPDGEVVPVIDIKGDQLLVRTKDFGSCTEDRKEMTFVRTGE